MSKTDRDQFIEKLFGAMSRHAEDSDEPDMVAGDLQLLLYGAIDVMDDKTFAEFAASSEVESILEWNDISQDMSLDDVSDNVMIGGDSDGDPFADPDEEDD